MVIFEKVLGGVRIFCSDHYNSSRVLLTLDGYEDLLKEYQNTFNKVGNVFRYDSLMRKFIHRNKHRDVRQFRKSLTEIISLDEDFQKYHRRFGHVAPPAQNQFYISKVPFKESFVFLGYVRVYSYMICCCCKHSHEDALKVCREKLAKFQQYSL